MELERKSPRIIRISWGRVEIEGQRTFKDAKLYPGGSREWDWGETGTDHESGIQPSDVEELLKHGAKILVLSKGMYGRFGVSRETLEMLKEKRIPVHVLQTEEAAQKYNELQEKEQVGGLFHSTC